LEYLEPSLLVQTILSQSPTASEYFALALAQYEGTKMNPLSCVIGFDEFQSGSLNRPDSSKKYMCLYFTSIDSLCHRKISYGSVHRLPEQSSLAK
jgi:hypothetical protein